MFRPCVPFIADLVLCGLVLESHKDHEGEHDGREDHRDCFSCNFANP